MSGQHHDTNPIDDIEPITGDDIPTEEHASGGYKVPLEREDRTPAERIIRRLRERYQDWKEKRERKRQAKRAVGIPEHSTGGGQRGLRGGGKHDPNASGVTVGNKIDKSTSKAEKERRAAEVEPRRQQGQDNTERSDKLDRGHGPDRKTR